MGHLSRSRVGHKFELRAVRRSSRPRDRQPHAASAAAFDPDDLSVRGLWLADVLLPPPDGTGNGKVARESDRAMKQRLRAVIELDQRSALLCAGCIVLGLAILSLAGKYFASTNHIDPEDFQRFHLYINPQTLYYPT